MLKKTFCHVDGVSINTEKLLWENGISTWEDFFININNINFISKSKLEKIKTELLFSQEELEKNNLNYFKKKIPPKEHYRLVNYGKIAYVDIETTGLSRYTDKITMIGIYDGETAKSYISGKDLDEAYEKLKEFEIIVTFNGKTFDLPFIEQKSKIDFDLIHLDLRFMLKEFDLAGGLKKIERNLGITRVDEVKDVDGFEAVRLWRRYQNGDHNALNTLLIYNREDIVNLKTLLNWYLDKKLSKNKINIPIQNLNQF